MLISICCRILLLVYLSYAGTSAYFITIFWLLTIVVTSKSLKVFYFQEIKMTYNKNLGVSSYATDNDTDKVYPRKLGKNLDKNLRLQRKWWSNKWSFTQIKRVLLNKIFSVWPSYFTENYTWGASYNEEHWKGLSMEEAEGFST